MSGPCAYAVYWSIYTDQRGRRQFRKLYWDPLKDLIGRPAHLAGIEREAEWPSGRPRRELRCHVWRTFAAHSDADAILETMRAACRAAPEWRVWIAPATARDEVLEILWDRDRPGALRADLPLPQLNSIMVSVYRDTGFRVGPGYRIANGRENSRARTLPVLATSGMRASFAATWRLSVQTSTKRELMEKHWPLLQRRFGEGAEMIEVEKRSGDVGPFRFSIRRIFRDVTEGELVTAVLTLSTGMHVSLATRSDGTLAQLSGVRSGPPAGVHVCGLEVLPQEDGTGLQGCG